MPRLERVFSPIWRLSWQRPDAAEGAMLDLLVRNGTIVDGHGSARGSLAVTNGRIAARFMHGTELPQAHTVIDADDLLILPGIVDPHVHFYGEGIGGYSRLAAMGGVTTFIGMIRGQPDELLADVLAAHLAEAMRSSLVDFSFHVVLYDRKEVLAQIAGLAADGFCSYKMFLAYKRRGMMVREDFLFAAMREISRLGGIALLHAEDGELIDNLEQAAVAAGRVKPEDYAPTRPPQAEACAVDMGALAAEATRCRTYIVHVSSSAALGAVERARRRGVRLIAETCPQYLLLDDGDVRRHGPAAVIAPPLRSAADQVALGTALATGAINTIGSDHASHETATKARGENNIFLSPFGMPGAPTLLPAMFTWAVDHGVPLSILVRAMSEMPASVFGLGHCKGSLLPGQHADILLIDPQQRRVVDSATIWPNVCPSPLAGRLLAGWPLMTIARGDVIYRDGTIVGEGGRGQRIAQRTHVSVREMP
jgi:dihydroorotase (multifunctional complex type)